MSWKIFAGNSPELASFCLARLNRKIAYLATLKPDGSPRLHPVTPFIGNGMLFIFTEPSSPKIGDLERDGRYAMHSSVDREDPLTEVLFSGKALVVSDPILRAEAEKLASSPVVIDSYYLFEFLVERVLAVEYDEGGKRNLHRWRAE